MSKIESQPPEFPDEILVKWESHGMGPYMIVAKSIDEIAEVGSVKKIGRYLLVETLSVEAKPMITARTPVKLPES